MQGGQRRQLERVGDYDSGTPRSLFGPLIVLEGRGRQRKKEGGTNAGEEGGECTQRKVAGGLDGGLIAVLSSTKSVRRHSQLTSVFVPNEEIPAR